MKTHFEDVIAWVESVFSEYYGEMCGLKWGQLYDEYHTTPYDQKKMTSRAAELMVIY